MKVKLEGKACLDLYLLYRRKPLLELCRGATENGSCLVTNPSSSHLLPDLRAAWAAWKTNRWLLSSTLESLQVVYHTPPWSKSYLPQWGGKTVLAQLQRAQRREAPTHENELRSSTDDAAGGLACIHEGHPGCLPPTEGCVVPVPQAGCWNCP